MEAKLLDAGDHVGGAGTLYMNPVLATDAWGILDQTDGGLRTKTTGSKVVIGNFEHDVVYGHPGEVDVYLGDINISEVMAPGRERAHRPSRASGGRRLEHLPAGEAGGVSVKRSLVQTQTLTTEGRHADPALRSARRIAPHHLRWRAARGCVEQATFQSPLVRVPPVPDRGGRLRLGEGRPVDGRPHAEVPGDLGDLKRFQEVYPGKDPTEDGWFCETCLLNGYDITSLLVESDRHWATISEEPQQIIEALYRRKDGARSLQRLSLELLEQVAQVDPLVADAYRVEHIS